MIAYQFYLYNKGKGYQLVGVLPERRKKSERINRESILNWGTKFFPDVDGKNCFFVGAEIEDNGGKRYFVIK